MRVLVSVRTGTSTHRAFASWSIVLRTSWAAWVVALRRAVVRSWRSTVVRRTTVRHTVVAHRRGTLVHARVVVPSTTSVSILDSFTLNLGLDSLAVGSVSDHREHRSDDSDEFSSLTWLCVVESSLNDIVGE